MSVTKKPKTLIGLSSAELAAVLRDRPVSECCRAGVAS